MLLFHHIKILHGHGVMEKNKVWWQKDPLEFNRFKRELEEFESLNYEIQEQKITITGSWAVFGKTNLIRRYEIKMVLPDDFPKSPPIVYETDGKIRKEPKYHMNPGSNSACLFSKPERYEKWPIGSGIREFLNGPVRDFFFSQAYRKLTGKWPFDEWSHENEGVLEYYASKIGVGEVLKIEKFLRLAILPKILRQWKCPCGSKKRLIKCHKDQLIFLSKMIPQKELIEAIQIAELETKKGVQKVKIRNT
jgi:hypothetical protein